MAEPQSLKNHARLDPLQHLIAVPILLVNFIAVVVVTIGIALHHEGNLLGVHIWLVVMSFALLVAVVNMRLKDLRTQDRVIRLEERVRYSALLPAAELETSKRLQLRQIIALRFASDAELPALIARTVAENLTSKQIKQSIATWRPDDLRV